MLRENKMTKQKKLLSTLFVCIMAIFCHAWAENIKLLSKNPTFASKDGSAPDNWGTLQFRQKTVAPQLVKGHAMLDGKSGIEIPDIPAEHQGNAFVGIGQACGFEELKETRRLIIRLLGSAIDLENGSVVVYADDKAKKTVYWKTVGHLRGNFSMNESEFMAEIPAGAVYVNVSIRNSGPGTLWLAKAEFFWENNKATPTTKESTPDTADGALAGNLIANPLMKPSTEGNLPASWTRFTYPGHEAEFDAECNNGVCTLTHRGGASKFGVASSLKGNISGGRLYHIQARFMTDSGGRFMVSAEFFNEKGESLGEQISPVYGSGKETVFKWDTKAPPAAKTMQLRWLNSSSGIVKFRLPSCKMGAAIAVAERFPIRMRLCPADMSSDWKGGKPCFYTFKNTELPLCINLCGEKAKLKNPAILIEMPDELELTCYSSYPTVSLYKPIEGKIVSRANGKTLWRFEDVPLWGALKQNFGAQRTVIASIRGPKASGRFYSAACWAENDGCKGDVFSFDISLLDDPPDIPMPKDFFIGRWRTLDFYPFDKDAFRRLSATLQRCGMKQASIPWGDNPHLLGYIDELRQMGWHANCGYIEGDYEIKCDDGYQLPPAITSAGTIRPNTTCPERLLDHPSSRKALLDHVMAGWKNVLRQGDYVAWDYEPFETMEWCFCDYCREKFARRLKLPATPTANEIRRNHAEAWVRFRCENTRNRLALYREAASRKLPKVKILDYDYVVDYSNPEAPMAKFMSVCKDPVLNDDVLDGHFQSYYYIVDHEAFRMIRINRRKFKGDYIPMGGLAGTSNGWLAKDGVLSPERVRLMVWSSVLNGCGSYWLYPGLVDAIYLTMFHRTLGIIAILEKEPLWKKLISDGYDDAVVMECRPYGMLKTDDGKTISTPSWKSLSECLKAVDGRQALVAIVNYYEKPLFADVKTQMPEGRYVMENVLTGEIMYSGNARGLADGILIKAPARDAVFFRIRAAGNETVPDNEGKKQLEKEYQDLCKGDSSNLWKPLESNGFSIVPGDVDGDGNPEMMIKCKNASVAINIAKGAALAWNADGHRIDGEWGLSTIWLPETRRSRNCPWALRSKDIDTNGASIVIGATMDDIDFLKTFRLSKEGELHVTMTIKNNSAISMDMTPKLCHFLKLATFVLDNGKKMDFSASRENVVPSPLGRHDGFDASIVRNVGAKKPCISAEIDGISIECAFPNPERWMCYYFWSDAAGKTRTWEYIWLPETILPDASADFPCIIRL